MYNTYMTDYEQRARELFTSGYNCAQSTFCTFAEEIGMDFDTALKLSSSFGGGMGRLREVCGAVSAMFMIAGIKHGYTSNNDDTTKEKHYQLIQDLAEEFKKTNKTIICRELLGLPEGADSPTPSKRTAEYYQERPCEDIVASAVKIIQEKLLN